MQKTVILSPSASLNLGSTCCDGCFRQVKADGLPSSIVPSNANCEPISTPKRACEPMKRASARLVNEDPCDGMETDASVPKYDVPLPRQLVYDGKMSWDSFIKPFMSTAAA